MALRAPCASSEDLTFRDSSPEASDDEEAAEGRVRVRQEEATPTPSDVSLGDDGGGADSLAVTPVHHPRQDIDLCFEGERKE